MRNTLSKFLFDKKRKPIRSKRSIADLRYNCNSMFEFLSILRDMKIIKPKTYRAYETLIQMYKTFDIRDYYLDGINAIDKKRDDFKFPWHALKDDL